LIGFSGKASMSLVVLVRRGRDRDKLFSNDRMSEQMRTVLAKLPGNPQGDQKGGEVQP
jgi:hypothetical protein